MAVDQERIQKSIRKLWKYVKNVPKQPSPGEIHKLRTNARKIEANLKALSLESNKSEQRLLKCVKQIRKRAGKVRDLDVLTRNLATVHADGEAECEVMLLEYLGRKRQKQARKLHTVISNERTGLKKRLRRASAHVDKFLKKNEPEPASLAAAHALQLSSQLQSPSRLNRGNLHAYRLKVKELRYVLQLSASADRQFVDDLGNVKDAIGDWHDWEELISIATNKLDHGTACRLLPKIKDITESTYQQALNMAGDFRRKYLDVAKGKRPSRTLELKPAVLDAMGKLSRARAA